MKYNLLVWCVHSCRRDVFLEELGKGKIPNFQSLIERGLLMSSAIVGGHYQKVSNHSEITGRPATSTVSPADNLLNAAKHSGTHVAVVNDGAISSWAKEFVAKGIIDSLEDIYPEFLPPFRFSSVDSPQLKFRPDLSPDRWLYWYRCRSTHRPFASLPLAFGRDGGFLEEVVNENPGFVLDMQRYALWLQDRWFGETLNYLEEAGAIDDTVVCVFSTHGTSLEGWVTLAGKVTKATVDHTSFNFHPNVSRSFAILAGPGVPQGQIDHWVSIMDLKPTLAQHLDLENLGGSVYDVNWLRTTPPESRILADISSREWFSLYDSGSEWLYMSLPMDCTGWKEGLPQTDNGYFAFHIGTDPICGRPRNEDFLQSGSRARIEEEIKRLNLTNRLA